MWPRALPNHNDQTKNHFYLVLDLFPLQQPFNQHAASLGAPCVCSNSGHSVYLSFWPCKSRNHSWRWELSRTRTFCGEPTANCICSLGHMSTRTTWWRRTAGLWNNNHFNICSQDLSGICAVMKHYTKVLKLQKSLLNKSCPNIIYLIVIITSLIKLKELRYSLFANSLT